MESLIYIIPMVGMVGLSVVLFIVLKQVGDNIDRKNAAIERLEKFSEDLLSQLTGVRKERDSILNKISQKNETLKECEELMEEMLSEHNSLKKERTQLALKIASLERELEGAKNQPCSHSVTNKEARELLDSLEKEGFLDIPTEFLEGNDNITKKTKTPKKKKKKVVKNAKSTKRKK